MAGKVVRRREEKPMELEALKDMIMSVSMTGSYYFVKAPGAPVTEFMFMKQTEASSLLEDIVSAVRIFEVNEVPSPRFGVKLALDWKKRFLSSEPYFDAVDETFDELAKKLNSDKQLVKTISDLKPSLLEMSYVGSDKGGPGVYGAPEITFRKPTMSIELRFTISRLMNVRNIFLSGLNIIKQVEGRVLEELEPNQ